MIFFCPRLVDAANEMQEKHYSLSADTIGFGPRAPQLPAVAFEAFADAAESLVAKGTDVKLGCIIDNCYEEALIRAELHFPSRFEHQRTPSCFTFCSSD